MTCAWHVYRPWWVAALLLGGCRDDGGSSSGFPPELNGELGRGDFLYRCIDDSDAYCEGDAFPPALARGARFDLDYAPGTPLSLSGLSVESGSAFTDELGELFEVRDSGRFVMLAVHQGDVVDLVHVLGEPIADVAVEDPEGFVIDEVQLQVGETVELQALPLDPQGRLLAGSLQYDWSVQTPAASLRAPGLDPRQIELTADTLGSTTLTVVVGDAVRSLPVVVTDGLGDEDDASGSTGGQ